MSDPKVKPSIAARELGKDIQDYLGMQNCSKPIQEMIAKRIQLALGELLTQAQYVVDAGPNEVVACQHFFAIALEPWKTPE